MRRATHDVAVGSSSLLQSLKTQKDPPKSPIIYTPMVLREGKSAARMQQPSTAPAAGCQLPRPAQKPMMTVYRLIAWYKVKVIALQAWSRNPLEPEGKGCALNPRQQVCCHCAPEP